jgi:tight adherence protein B
VRRRVVAAAVLALVLPSAASASVVVRRVDTTQYPRMGVTVVTSKPSATPPTLTEGGKPAIGLTAVNLGHEKSVVLVLDRSQSMRGKPLADAVAAARAFLAARQPGDRIAIVGFGQHPVQLTPFSNSSADADAALSALTVDAHQGTSLYDAVQLSSQLLAGEKNRGRVIVLVTDGRDQSSISDLKSAVAEAGRAGATVYAVGIVGPQFTPDALQEIARRTGGLYRAAQTTAALSGIYTAIAEELRRTWRLEYVTAARPGDKLTVDVSSPSLGSAQASVVMPSSRGKTAGSSQLPGVVFTPGGTAVLGLIVGLIVLAAVALLLASFREGRLRAMLAPHLGQRKARVKRRTNRERLAALAGLFRATEKAFSHTNLWKKISKLIERADLPIRTVEFVYLTLGGALGLGWFMAIAGSGTLGIFVGFLLGGSAPTMFLMFKASRRRNAFENQLPDLLVALAASLKAGHSFKSAIQALVDEGAEPASKEFKRVLAESRLGRPIEDSLEEMARRVGSPNFAFIVTAVNIQTQVGGSLAGLFDMVADTVRQRHQFQRKIKSLTAMGRMSAYTLVGLPIFVAGVLSLLNGKYMSPLWHSSTGHMMVIVAVVMILFGSLILKKIVSFKG